MATRRRVAIADGEAALRAWLADPAATDRPVLATAVRYTLEELAARHPGATCEVRVAPFGVVQALAGPRHTRGTPPNVVQADAATWLALVAGRLTWAEAAATGRVLASGERSDLSGYLPLFDGSRLGG